MLEHLRPGFDKLAINPGNVHGWSWQPYMHRIWLPDVQAHDHCGDMTVVVVRGPGYIEEIFKLRDGKLVLIDRCQRRLGDRFEIKGECIHRIAEIFGETFTLVEHEPNRREFKLYDI